jgi:hypothetical protein
MNYSSRPDKTRCRISPYLKQALWNLSALDGKIDAIPCSFSVAGMIKPPYQLNGLNAPIRLYDGKLEVFRKGIGVGGHGKIEFDWFPQHGIAFRSTE